MTLEIVAQRDSERMCDKHPDERLVEVLVRSDKLKSDWLLSICPICHNKMNTEDDDEKSQ